MPRGYKQKHNRKELDSMKRQTTCNCHESKRPSGGLGRPLTNGTVLSCKACCEALTNVKSPRYCAFATSAFLPEIKYELTKMHSLSAVQRAAASKSLLSEQALTKAHKNVSASAFISKEMPQNFCRAQDVNRQLLANLRHVSPANCVMTAQAPLCIAKKH